MNDNVFDMERKYLESIHLNSCEKLDGLNEMVGIEQLDLKEVENIENITNHLMKKSDKSDENFLRWMYVIGSHIKMKFNGSWILVHYKGDNVDRYVPAVVNDDQEIWEVGNFCYRYYFAKNRMKGISFSTFYKLEINRAIWKPKLKDINIPLENIVFLEQEI